MIYDKESEEEVCDLFAYFTYKAITNNKDTQKVYTKKAKLFKFLHRNIKIMHQRGKQWK